MDLNSTIEVTDVDLIIGLLPRYDQTLANSTTNGTARVPFIVVDIVGLTLSVYLLVSVVFFLCSRYSMFCNTTE